MHGTMNNNNNNNNNNKPQHTIYNITNTLGLSLHNAPTELPICKSVINTKCSAFITEIL